MKYIFLGFLAALLIATAVTQRMQKADVGTAPLIYWVSDPNPARTTQIQLFQQWMAKNHPDSPVDMRLDAANDDPSKRIIQSVSGVGDDVIDCYGGAEIHYFQTMGICADLMEPAARLEFSLDHTYSAVRPDLSVRLDDGKVHQFAFPCNVSTDLYMVNRATFAKYNLSPPPTRWNLDEFEAFGKKFVDAANPNPKDRQVFFADSIPLPIIRRSLGLNAFNETGTRCILDRPENVQALNLDYRWTYTIHLLPSTAEASAVATQAGFAGAVPQLFNSGNYAMMWTGRWMVIQFRQFDESRKTNGEPLLDLDVAEPPNGGFPNTDIFTRAGAVYAGGKHRDLAEYFLQFLASKEYNMEVVSDGDALPPDPIYAKTEEYLHPKDHPNEWRVHGAFADAASNLAISDSYSPFVLTSIVQREDGDAIDAFMNKQLTAEQAGKRAADRINDEIQRSLNENPSLRPRYDELCQLQKKIDDLRAAGQKIPAAWITDPFYLAYYQHKGWLQ